MISFLTACVLSAAFGVFAASAETARPSFDCAKASTKVEKAICSDEELAKQDVRLNEVYGKLLSLFSKKGQKSFRANQRTWLKWRNIYCDIELDPALNPKKPIPEGVVARRNERIRQCSEGDFVSGFTHEETKKRITAIEDIILWIQRIPPSIWQREHPERDENKMSFNFILRHWPERGTSSEWEVSVPYEEAGIPVKRESADTVSGFEAYRGISPKDGRSCSAWNFVKEIESERGWKSNQYGYFYVTSDGIIIKDSLDLFDWKFTECRDRNIEKEIEEETDWIVYPFRNGTYEALSLKPQRNVLDNFEYNVIQLHGKELKYWQAHYNKNEFNFAPAEKLIGIWNGYEIYLIIEKNVGIAQLVVKLGEEDYKILYSVLGTYRMKFPLGPWDEIQASIESSKYGDRLSFSYWAEGIRWTEGFILHPETKRPIMLQEMPY